MRIAMSLTVTFRGAPVGVFVRKSAGTTDMFGSKQKNAQRATFSRKFSSKKVADEYKSFAILSHMPKWDSIKGQSAEYCSRSVSLPGPDMTELSTKDVSQRSEEWFALRRHRLTASAFSTALGFWGDRRIELWEEKVFGKQELVSNEAMSWGVHKEDTAIESYKDVTGNIVDQLGFQIYHEENDQLQWLGASPDGLIKRCLSGVAGPDSGGILEVKCPFNKGKPELGLPWSWVPYYYMPQLQGLMEILDRNWIDLYCWTPTGSTIFRIQRDNSYWALIFEPMKEFWWENVVPARKALETQGEDSVYQYKPSSQHRCTNDIIAQSKALAKSAPLICREVSGHVEFFLQ